MKAADVLHWLEKAVAQHGAPEYLRSDNGSEFIAKIVQRWLQDNRIKTIYIEPGSPWQNGFVESFHGRFRDECLNREQLWNLTETLTWICLPSSGASSNWRRATGNLRRIGDRRRSRWQ